MRILKFLIIYRTIKDLCDMSLRDQLYTEGDLAEAVRPESLAVMFHLFHLVLTFVAQGM